MTPFLWPGPAPSDAREARQAWAIYLAAHEWAHTVTLTAARPTSCDRLVREFVDVFVRNLARMAQRRVCWFYAGERHASDAPHLHGLLSGTEGLSPRDVERRWRLGRAQAARYEHDRGGTAYVTKALGEELEQYDVSPRRPPVRSARAAAA